MRRRDWTVFPVLPPESASWLGPALLRDLCGGEPVPAAPLPPADVLVLAPWTESLRAWLAARPGAVDASGRVCPAVCVPVAATAGSGAVPELACGCRLVPPALPLLGGGVPALWMADPEAVCETVAAVASRQDLAAQAILVTAGPTAEDIDPVRFLTNRSSGLMGVALALAAWRRGAAVTLVHGPLQVAVPRLPGLETVPVRSAREMHAAVMGRIGTQAAAILCAAVADFAPAHCEERKIKKAEQGGRTLELQRTPDILAAVGALPRRPFLVGFAAETHDLEAHALEKLRRKNCDLLCANDVTEPGSGFAVATNRITLFARDGSVTPLPLLSKGAAAEQILDRVVVGLAAGGSPPAARG